MKVGNVSHVAALKRAVDIAGGQSALAAKMREHGGRASTATQQLIWYWLNDEVLIGAEWWPSIEFATENAVTRRDLRPDVFAPSHAA